MNRKTPSPFEVSEIRYYINLKPPFYCTGFTEEQVEDKMRFGNESRQYNKQLVFLQWFYVSYVYEKYIPTNSIEERKFLKAKISEFLEHLQVSV